MKAAENTITMLGEQMEVFIGAGCLSGCKPKIASRFPTVISNLCRTLSKRSVARTFMNHVRIGDTVTLVDKRNGYAFQLKMEAHSVCILEIDFTAAPPKDASQVYYLANYRLWQRYNGRNGLAVTA